ncbi:hypothetical protein FMEAI12_3350019 [Parafrankia sp. Ea1.12]|nr:hypothetical protein FMEAI12_3350019 [Parafrankia sp. Ea1.12]
MLRQTEWDLVALGIVLIGDILLVGTTRLGGSRLSPVERISLQLAGTNFVRGPLGSRIPRYRTAFILGCRPGLLCGFRFRFRLDIGVVVGIVAIVGVADDVGGTRLLLPRCLGSFRGPRACRDVGLLPGRLRTVGPAPGSGSRRLLRDVLGICRLPPVRLFRPVRLFLPGGGHLRCTSRTRRSGRVGLAVCIPGIWRSSGPSRRLGLDVPLGRNRWLGGLVGGPRLAGGLAFLDSGLALVEVGLELRRRFKTAAWRFQPLWFPVLLRRTLLVCVLRFVRRGIAVERTHLVLGAGLGCPRAVALVLRSRGVLSGAAGQAPAVKGRGLLPGGRVRRRRWWRRRRSVGRRRAVGRHSVSALRPRRTSPAGRRSGSAAPPGRRRRRPGAAPRAGAPWTSRR